MAFSAPEGGVGESVSRETRPLRVLAVDDDSTIRQLLVEVLTLAGCRVLAASDGMEALRILEGESVDLLITDYQMPRMNGLELLRWSKAHLPHVTVVMMTGRDSQSLAEEGEGCGALRVLRKPISIEHLLSLVREIRGMAPPS